MTGKVVATYSSQGQLANNATTENEPLSSTSNRYSPVEVATAVTFTVAVIQVIFPSIFPIHHHPPRFSFLWNSTRNFRNTKRPRLANENSFWVPTLREQSCYEASKWKVLGSNLRIYDLSRMNYPETFSWQCIYCNWEWSRRSLQTVS